MNSGGIARAARGAVAAFLISFGFSAAALAQPKVVLLGGNASEATISGSGEVRHKGANFLFPEHLGDMPLRKVEIYGPSDVSAGYTLYGGGNSDAWITFYVYPVRHPFADEVAQIEKDLTNAWGPTRVSAQAAIPSTATDGSAAWFKGSHDGLSALNGYVLVRRSNWFLMARWTVPDVAGAAGIQRTVKALESAPWNWRPASSPITGDSAPSIN